MKAILLFAFLAVGVSAVVAAPHVSNDVSVENGQKNLLIDIISALIGVDINAVVAQTEVTVEGLQRVLKQAGVELDDVLASSGQELVSQARAILADAAAKAHVILDPLVTLAERILSLLGITRAERIGGRDIIVDLIVALINRLIEMVEAALMELQQLSIDTILNLQNLAAQGGADTVAAVNEVAVRALLGAVLEIQPLLDLLAPLLEPQDPSDIINDLIKAILGLDISAIATQVDVTINGLNALFTSSSEKLNQILVSGGIDAQAQLQAVIDNANAEVEATLKPLVDLINLIISLIPAQGARAMQRNLISDIILALFQYIDNSVAKLEQIVVDTVNELVQVAVQAGANTAGAIEDLAQETTANAEALIQPLLDLLAPILPNTNASIAHLLKKRLH